MADKKQWEAYVDDTLGHLKRLMHDSPVGESPESIALAAAMGAYFELTLIQLGEDSVEGKEFVQVMGNVRELGRRIQYRRSQKGAQHESIN